MKYRVAHTHLNPKKGRNEPLFIVIDGAQADCKECQKAKQKKEKRK